MDKLALKTLARYDGLTIASLATSDLLVRIIYTYMDGSFTHEQKKADSGLRHLTYKISEIKHIASESILDTISVAENRYEDEPKSNIMLLVEETTNVQEYTRKDNDGAEPLPKKDFSFTANILDVHDEAKILETDSKAASLTASCTSSKQKHAGT